MKLEFTLVAERITRLEGDLVSVYPPAAEVPLGVGRKFAGKFVTLPGSDIQAYQEYTQTATAPGSVEGQSGILSLGQSCLHVTVGCDTMVIYYSFELITLDPSIPLTTGPVKGQVVSARLNGRPAKASVRFVTPDGGRSGNVTLKINYLC